MNPQPNLLKNVSMSGQTTWRAGGAARFGYAPESEQNLSLFLKSFQRSDCPIVFIGLGSNLLVRDGGLNALVIFTHRGLSVLNVMGEGANAIFYASAGVALPKLARFAANLGYEGSEFMAGIPGTVGGGLTMNAGCYGGEIWDCVQHVKTITPSGDIKVRSPSDYLIDYRKVTHKCEGEEFFIGAWFKFHVGDKQKARDRIRNLLRRRVQEQPLSKPNAGSVFRNPDDDFAARLIEAGGLKGRLTGGAEVSQRHANFIINTGGATAKDIEDLMVEVQSEVAFKYGITLKREIHILGATIDS